MQGIEKIEISVTSRNLDVLEIQISTSYYELTRVIDFRLKIINNSYMYVENGREGVGTRLFCNQVKEARKKRFSRYLYHGNGTRCWWRLGGVLLLGTFGLPDDK